MFQVSFNGLSLATRRGRVMTPRPASEQLVAAALDRVGSRPARVVDVGTGTGAIAVAIAKAAPKVQLFATDTSPVAVALARENARIHGVDDRVSVRRGDLLDPVPGPIDVVVANLPYLPAADAGSYPDLAEEPAAAVFAAGDGLEPYRRLLAACEERLQDDAWIMIQLHRRAIATTAARLPALHARLALAASTRRPAADPVAWARPGPEGWLGGTIRKRTRMEHEIRTTKAGGSPPGINARAPVVGSSQIEIAADPAAVWEVLTAFERWPSWNRDVKSMLVEGPVAVGTVFRWRSGPGTITSTIQRVEPPRLVAWTGRTLGIDAIHFWHLEPRDDGTLVRTEESFDGLLARVFHGSLQKKLDAALADGLRYLKAEVEGGR